MYGLSWNYQFNKMSFGNVFTRICDAFSFFYKYNDAAYGKKGNKGDKE